VISAARQLGQENNGVLTHPKVRVVIDDGRNYLLTTSRRWPVIISDSTHPKAPDSWVLYTREFYDLVRSRLDGGGVFVQWVPLHDLSSAEFKLIARTFQSVFPHASLWVTQGVDEKGAGVTYSLLAGTLAPLSIDLGRLGERLAAEPVRRDLAPFALDTAAGFLDGFICADEALRRWVGDGPVNTDNLPYTQYASRYASAWPMSMAEFAEPMEDLWPYVTGAESAVGTNGFRSAWLLRRQAAELGLAGRWSEAIALLPEDDRYREFGRLQARQAQCLDFLVQLYWDNPAGLNFWMGANPAGLRDASTAGRVYGRILELDPENPTALREMGALLLDIGDLARAEIFLRQAIRVTPHLAAAHYNLGILLSQTGRADEALEQWRIAATDCLGDPLAADHWGLCLLRQGNVPEATRWFARAVEMNPGSSSARLHLAGVLYHSGQKEAAMTQIRQAQKLDPNDPALLKIVQAIESSLTAESPPSP
jgi:tetratricopeptide (TPR) repeat protein